MASQLAAFQAVASQYSLNQAQAATYFISVILSVDPSSLGLSTVSNPGNPGGLSDAQTYLNQSQAAANRTLVSSNFAGQSAGASNLNYPVNGPTTNAGFIGAENSITGVNNLTSTVVVAETQVTAAAVANNPALITGQTPSGQTFTLTVNADGPGAVAPAVNTQGDTTPGTYNGLFQTTGGNDTGTFNTFDNLAGGSNPNNVLNVRVTAAAGTSSTNLAAGSQDVRAPIITNVPTINVANQSTGGAFGSYGTGAAGSATGISTISLSSASGYTRAGLVNSSSQTAWTELSGVANGTRIVMNNGDGGLAFQMDGTRTGTTDRLLLDISNGSGPGTSSTATAQIGAYTTLATASATGAAAVLDNTFEIVDITTTGAFSRVNLNVGTATGANSVNTVVVRGDGAGASTTGYALQLSQNQAFANVTSIDASGMTGTGGLYIITNNAQNLTFRGSSQNDRLDIGANANLTTADSITFGTGTDTIGFSDADARYGSAAKAVINGISGLEQIALYGTLTNADVSGYNAAINKFLIGSGSAQTVANNIIGVTGAVNLQFVNDMTGTAGAGGNAGADTITLTGSGVGSTASITLQGGIDIIGGLGAVGGANTGAAGGNAIDFGGNIVSLTISSIGTTANTLVGGGGGAANAGGGVGGAGAAAITSGTVQSYIITGSQDLSILGGAGGANVGANAAGAAGAGFSAAANINATALTGQLLTSGSNAQDIISVGTGGSQLSTVATSGSGDGDTITLNTGRDQLQVTFNSSNVNTSAAADLPPKGGPVEC